MMSTDAAVVLRTIARMARDGVGEIRGDIALLADEMAAKLALPMTASNRQDMKAILTCCIRARGLTPLGTPVEEAALDAMEMVLQASRGEL